MGVTRLLLHLRIQKRGMGERCCSSPGGWGVRVVRLTNLGRCLRRFRHPTPRGAQGQPHAALCRATRSGWASRTQREAFPALHAAAVRNHNACTWVTTALDEPHPWLIACSMERLTRPGTHGHAHTARRSRACPGHAQGPHLSIGAGAAPHQVSASFAPMPCIGSVRCSSISGGRGREHMRMRPCMQTSGPSIPRLNDSTPPGRREPCQS